MDWLKKFLKRLLSQDILRDKLVEMYGEEAGIYYDKINQGIPIGGFLETVIFLEMVKEADKLLEKK